MKKNLVEVFMVGLIILYEVIGVFSGGRILMKFVVEGFGVVVGGLVCVVLELVGVVDIIFKFLGLNILINVVCVIVEGLK